MPASSSHPTVAAECASNVRPGWRAAASSLLRRRAAGQSASARCYIQRLFWSRRQSLSGAPQSTCCSCPLGSERQRRRRLYAAAETLVCLPAVIDGPPTASGFVTQHYECGSLRPSCGSSAAMRRCRRHDKPST